MVTPDSFPLSVVSVGNPFFSSSYLYKKGPLAPFVEHAMIVSTFSSKVIPLPHTLFPSGVVPSFPDPLALRKIKIGRL